jgi:hypothetical protein
MRRRHVTARVRTVVAAYALLACTVTACSAAGGGPGGAGGVRLAMPEGRLPAETASDWVTYAEHVVVVDAVSEREIPPTRTELRRGEGLIGRTVTLRVDRVLWSSPGAAQPAPKKWEYSASGWTFTGGDPDDRTKMGVRGAPRVEVGHRYVMALDWEHARCSPGDGRRPAQWFGLSPDSSLAFDDDVLGQGEQEGRVRTAEEAREQADDDDGVAPTLEEKLIGKPASALVKALRAAKPEPDEDGYDRLPRAVDRCGDEVYGDD